MQGKGSYIVYLPLLSQTSYSVSHPAHVSSSFPVATFMYFVSATRPLETVGLVQHLQDTSLSVFTPLQLPRSSTMYTNLTEESIVTSSLILFSWQMEVGQEHTKQIKDMQLSYDGMLLITASKDTTARLWDVATLESLKMYKTDRPVNSAAISPLLDMYPHVVMGGGQEAMDVTTTSSRIGKFDARFFHLVFEEEFARVKGHFGPINSIAFHPNGKGYASGGEDGYVRVHVFDDAYYQFKFDF